MNKIRLALLCGGRSMEHQVSLLSTASVLNAIDRQKYELYLLAIDQQGAWHFYPRSLQPDYQVEDFFSHSQDAKRIALRADAWQTVVLTPQHPQGSLALLDNKQRIKRYLPVEVVFPIMHGSFAEDGKLQGLLEMLDLPYVGADVLSSALCMDKEVTKQLLAQNNLPVTNYLTLRQSDYLQGRVLDFSQAQQTLGLPIFVKPANTGSSVGVNKVTSAREWQAALKEAFRYDEKVLVEAGVQGREIECAVLGNRLDYLAGEVGEVRPGKKHGFYSYTAKYLDEEGAELLIPAPLNASKREEVRTLALQAFAALQGEGLARVDFFLEESGRLLINEVNTLPGFTKISMYPKLMMRLGLTYSQLIDRLIALAQARQQRSRQLQFAPQF